MFVHPNGPHNKKMKVLSQDDNVQADNILVGPFDHQADNTLPVVDSESEHVAITEPSTLQYSRSSSESITDMNFPNIDVSSNIVDHIELPVFVENIPAFFGCRTGRPPIQLYLTCDDDHMSQYQCLVRKQIELFEADFDDVESNAQGRNKPIVLGQVGIRCRHCNVLPPNERKRGSTYYPSKLDGIYQAASNLAIAHLGEHCQHICQQLRNHLTTLRDMKSIGGGGKKIWGERADVLGVFEDLHGLRFEPSINYKRRNYLTI